MALLRPLLAPRSPCLGFPPTFSLILPPVPSNPLASPATTLVALGAALAAAKTVILAAPATRVLMTAPATAAVIPPH